MIAFPNAIDTLRQLEEACDFLTRCELTDVELRIEALYAAWYASPRPDFAVDPGCPQDLTGMLRAAHARTSSWEDGWTVERIGPRGQAVLRRDAELRLVDRTDYCPVEKPGLLPKPGDRVSTTGRRDRIEPRDGWWRTFGRSYAWRQRPAGRLVRLYMGRNIAQVPSLVARVTELLDEEPSPWLLKCATRAINYARSDAVVLYLRPGTVARRADALTALGCQTGSSTGPALTLPIAQGLAAAFDPGADQSFGAHRCRLIAESEAHSPAAVMARFASEGIDPVRPWARMDDPLLPWEC